MANGFLSLKDETVISCKTNTSYKIGIDGKTKFYPETTGRALLALYLNLDLPPAGSAGRLDMSRGGLRYWFQQVSDAVDVTGLSGPWPLPIFGSQHQLVSHVWPHTVQTSIPWEFCFKLYSYGVDGKMTSHTFEVETKEVKIIRIPS